MKISKSAILVWLVGTTTSTTLGFIVPTNYRRNSMMVLLDSMTKESSSSSSSSVPTKTTNKKNETTNATTTTTKKKPQMEKKPWRANYVISTQTQAKLQKAARGNTNPVIRVLDTLLVDTTPEQCNESNVVCALTLSAKLLTTTSTIRNRKMKNLVKEKLIQVLDILYHEFLIPNRLQTRQLCNVAWAIAKIYDYDKSLLGVVVDDDDSSNNKINNRVYSNNVLTFLEEWDLSQQPSQNDDKVIMVMDIIAQQLTDIMSGNTNNRKKQYQPPKPGEIGMVTWAYAILYPRKKPPGWELPPRTTTATSSMQSTANTKNNQDIIKFEQFYASNDSDSDDNEENSTPTKQLFDAIADTLVTKDYVTTTTIKEPLLQLCSWKELANIAWAFATHGHTNTLLSETLMIHLAKEAKSRLDNTNRKNEKFIPRDISQIVWALGTAQSDNFHLSDALVDFVDSIAQRWILTTNNNDSHHRPFQRWKNADLVQLATSLAHGRIDNTGLLEAIFTEVLVSMNDELLGDSTLTSDFKKQQKFQSWELAVLLWTQARLYLTSQQSPIYSEFSSKVPRLLMQRLEDDTNGTTKSLQSIGLGSQEQANLAWSLTVLEQYHHDDDSMKLLQSIFQTAANNYYEKNNNIQLEHAHQLWQAYFLLKDEQNDKIHVPVPFEAYLQQQWKLEKNRRKTSSARHTSLSKTLNFMGVAHYNEHEEDIDVAIVLQTESCWTHTAENNHDHNPGNDNNDHDEHACHHKVAVEFDGPSHFVRAPSSSILMLDSSSVTSGGKNQLRAMGHTVLKYRMLKKQGWTVVRVPYYEYDKIPFWASMERQRYLQRLLKTHANIRFSDVDVSEYKAIVHNRQSRFD